MKQEYKILNRYREDITLTEVSPNVYKLSCTHADYMRFGLFNNNKDGYYFVDPPGGPFMKVGYFELDDKVLTSIKNEGKDILLTFGDREQVYHKEAVELNKIITNAILKYLKANDMEVDQIVYNMTTTYDSVNAGEWLPDTDACLEIRNEGKTLGFNA